VSYTKVLKVKRNLRHWGTARAPRIIAQGRTPKITAAMGEALDELLLIKPSHYVDEMVWFIWDEFNILVTESTVNFALFPFLTIPATGGAAIFRSGKDFTAAFPATI
jgi:hypothetical protein